MRDLNPLFASLLLGSVLVAACGGDDAADQMADAAPIGILITWENRIAFVANTRDDKVTVIDLVRWEVAGEILTGDEPTEWPGPVRRTPCL